MIRIVLVLAACFLFGCIAGKDGKDGEDGRDFRQFTYTGVLYAADTSMNGSAVYWDKTFLTLTDSSIVNVWVRQGSGYLWQTPTWYASTGTLGYIRIVDDEKVNAAYEYKIIVGN